MKKINTRLSAYLYVEVGDQWVYSFPNGAVPEFPGRTWKLKNHVSHLPGTGKAPAMVGGGLRVAGYRIAGDFCSAPDLWWSLVARERRRRRKRSSRRDLRLGRAFQRVSDCENRRRSRRERAAKRLVTSGRFGKHWSHNDLPNLLAFTSGKHASGALFPRRVRGARGSIASAKELCTMLKGAAFDTSKLQVAEQSTCFFSRSNLLARICQIMPNV